MARRRKPTGSPGYIPPKERREAVNKAADKQLDRFIKDKYESTKNQDAGVASIVQDMPKKFADNFVNADGEIGNPTPGKKSRYYRADGSLNSAGLATLSQYTDERPEYSRQLNRLRTSSPQMMDAFARRFPKTNFAMKMLPTIAGAATGVPFGLIDLYNKGKDKFTNLSDRGDILGAIARTTNDIASSFTPEQAKNIDTNIETKKPIDKVLRDENIINASTDVDPILNAAAAQTGSQDIVDIFDNDGEKAAIDASLPTGDIVYNPYVEAPYQSKLDFINEVYETNFTADRSGSFLREDQANKLFEKAKQEQGGIIRDEVNRDLNVDDEDPIPGGQFNLTRPTVNEDTVSVILGGDPNYEYDNYDVNQQLADVLPTDDILAQGNEKRSFVDDNYGKENPNIFLNDQRFDMFPEGGVSGNFVDNMGTGTEMIGDSIFATEPGSQSAFDTLNSNATSGFTGQPTLRYNFADGGSTNKYENMSTHEKLMRMAAEMYG